jgi:hypothetical protein
MNIDQVQNEDGNWQDSKSGDQGDELNKNSSDTHSLSGTDVQLCGRYNTPPRAQPLSSNLPVAKSCVRQLIIGGATAGRQRGCDEDDDGSFVPPSNPYGNPPSMLQGRGPHVPNMGYEPGEFVYPSAVKRAPKAVAPPIVKSLNNFQQSRTCTRNFRENLERELHSPTPGTENVGGPCGMKRRKITAEEPIVELGTESVLTTERLPDSNMRLAYLLYDKPNFTKPETQRSQIRKKPQTPGILGGNLVDIFTKLNTNQPGWECGPKRQCPSLRDHPRPVDQNLKPQMPSASSLASLSLTADRNIILPPKQNGSQQIGELFFASHQHESRANGLNTILQPVGTRSFSQPDPTAVCTVDHPALGDTTSSDEAIGDSEVEQLGRGAPSVVPHTIELPPQRQHSQSNCPIEGSGVDIDSPETENKGLAESSSKSQAKGRLLDGNLETDKVSESKSAKARSSASDDPKQKRVGQRRGLLPKEAKERAKNMRSCLLCSVARVTVSASILTLRDMALTQMAVLRRRSM